MHVLKILSASVAALAWTAHAASVHVLTSAERNRIVELHNIERQLVEDGQVGGQPTAENIPDLTWSTSLASAAATEGLKCLASHSGQNSIDGHGENLAMTTEGVDSWTVDDWPAGWIEEKLGYTWPGYCYGYASCKHYTQMVWADTTQVGCAVVENCAITVGSWTYRTKFVCRYSDAGNVVGQTPYDCKNNDCTLNSGAPTKRPTPSPTPSPSCYEATSSVNWAFLGVYSPVSGVVFGGKQAYQNSAGNAWLYYTGSKWAIGGSLNANSFYVLCTGGDSDEPTGCSGWSASLSVVTSTACGSALNSGNGTEDELEDSDGSEPAVASWSWLVLLVGLLFCAVGAALLARAHLLQRGKVQVSVPDDDNAQDAEQKTLEEREVEIETEFVSSGSNN